MGVLCLNALESTNEPISRHFSLVCHVSLCVFLHNSCTTVFISWEDDASRAGGRGGVRLYRLTERMRLEGQGTVVFVVSQQQQRHTTALRLDVFLSELLSLSICPGVSSVLGSMLPVVYCIHWTALTHVSTQHAAVACPAALHKYRCDTLFCKAENNQKKQNNDSSKQIHIPNSQRLDWQMCWVSSVCGRKIKLKEKKISVNYSEP